MTGLLTAGHITQLRAASNRLLPDTCTIQRVVRTPGDDGGWTEDFATLSTVACRVAASGLSPAEQLLAERLTSETVFVITLPALTTAVAADRIVWTDEGTVLHTFDVIAVRPRAEELTRRVLGREVT